jgi:uncharacterized membrane protein YheB (UPF0754 family)
MLIYLLPFISALIGWFTNYIAVKMLFRPRNKIDLGFMELQGIFPKRQALLAEKIGRMVADDLLSPEDIKEKMITKENIEAIKNIIESKIDNYLTTTFPQKYPITSMFFGSNRKKQIRQDLIEEVERVTPSVISEYVQIIEDKINVDEIVREKVESFPPDRLEQILNSILKKEFKFIEFIGAIIGFIIGILQIFLAKLS